jgi:hypothetical protein
VREALGNVLDEVPEDRFVVIADNKDFFDLGDLGNSSEAVLDYGMAGDWEEGLRWCQANGILEQREERMGYTFGRSRERGLNRVPRDGPPT